MALDVDEAAVRSRLVPLTGAYNFRDLGGYPTQDGRVTGWNRLFRSDALHELTESDVVVLRELGLRSIIDLRTPAEVERTGRGPLAGERVRYQHLSVTRQEAGESMAAPTQFHANLAERYLWYLDVGADSLMSALTTIADPGQYPMVFHCAAGKDRTGVLAALVLDLLGVQRETIVQDYALTATRMGLIMERLRRDPAVGDRIAEIPPHLFAVDPSTMETFLDLLHDHHGGAYAWARDAGMSEETLTGIRQVLLAA